MPNWTVQGNTSVDKAQVPTRDAWPCRPPGIPTAQCAPKSMSHLALRRSCAGGWLADAPAVAFRRESAARPQPVRGDGRGERGAGRGALGDGVLQQRGVDGSRTLRSEVAWRPYKVTSPSMHQYSITTIIYSAVRLPGVWSRANGIATTNSWCHGSWRHLGRSLQPPTGCMMPHSPIVFPCHTLQCESVTPL